MQEIDQRLARQNTAASTKMRQAIKVAQLKVGMTYNWKDVGLADRTIHRSWPGGSETTYIHGTSYITVDDATKIIISIVHVG